MKRAVHSHQVDGIDVVAVDYLQLLPRDRSGLTLQQVQTWDVKEENKPELKVPLKINLNSIYLIKNKNIYG